MGFRKKNSKIPTKFGDLAGVNKAFKNAHSIFKKWHQRKLPTFCLIQKKVQMGLDDDGGRYFGHEFLT